MSITIQHRPAQHRFEAVAEGGRGRLEYRTAPGVMTLVHTEVDPALEGQGVAGRLVAAALDHARAHGLKVDPACDYARGYMERHPETQALHV